MSYHNLTIFIKLLIKSVAYHISARSCHKYDVWAITHKVKESEGEFIVSICDLVGEAYIIVQNAISTEESETRYKNKN